MRSRSLLFLAAFYVGCSAQPPTERPLGAGGVGQTGSSATTSSTSGATGTTTSSGTSGATSSGSTTSSFGWQRWWGQCRGLGRIDGWFRRQRGRDRRTGGRIGIRWFGFGRRGTERCIGRRGTAPLLRPIRGRSPAGARDAPTPTRPTRGEPRSTRSSRPRTWGRAASCRCRRSLPTGSR